jgi:hypothetical protein
MAAMDEQKLGELGEQIDHVLNKSLPSALEQVHTSILCLSSLYLSILWLSSVCSLSVAGWEAWELRWGGAVPGGELYRLAEIRWAIE